jgi:DNA-binding MarR family transcriptional regulator/GNAT superfamily N-acetyltransferase
MTRLDLDEKTAEMRAFNRFYTKVIGVLEKGYLDSPFSLTEVRVFYELRHRGRTSAAELSRELGLDAGYLSRLLARFEGKGLLRREADVGDGRRSNLVLTDAGKAVFDPLEAKASEGIANLLQRLDAADQNRLLGAMATVRRLLEPGGAAPAPWLLRQQRPGDLGWIVQRHGEIYASEYGWDWTFEALVAGIAADLARNFDPASDQCWLAEQSGRNIGSVALVRKSDTVAQLRILLVEPDARGLGVGRRLVEECIEFSRRAGYRGVTLSTYSCLAAARRIYQAAGFRLASETPERAYGHDLVAETWDLAL